MTANLSRRTFIGRLGAVAAAPFVLRLPLARDAIPRAPARIAVIADLHHGLAPDAITRFRAFADAISKRRSLGAVLQLGDFCYSDASSAECLDIWRAIPGTRLSVLGNHDMDRGDKDTALRAWGMPSRYWSRVVGGYRFVTLDLNNLKKDGVLLPYANGNYFETGVTTNWADREQLVWLAHELERSAEPVVLISHQPLGIGEPGQPLPPEQTEVLAVVATAASANPAGKVVVCMSGHLHVDRLEYVDGIPCVSINSASYFWYEGMHAYTEPLFAFMEFTASGELVIEGRAGAFVSPPPAASDVVVGRSGSLSSRRVELTRG
jgi:predicted phosphodiesterase